MYRISGGGWNNLVMKIYVVIWYRMKHVMYIHEGTADICAIPIAVNITKNASIKPYPDVIYYTSPGPVFHVDSESEVRISILYPCHQLWSDLCWMTAYEVDSHIANFATISFTNPTVRGWYCMSKWWGEIVCAPFVNIAHGKPILNYGGCPVSSGKLIGVEYLTVVVVWWAYGKPILTV